MKFDQPHRKLLHSQMNVKSLNESHIYIYHGIGVLVSNKRKEKKEFALGNKEMITTVDFGGSIDIKRPNHMKGIFTQQ